MAKRRRHGEGEHENAERWLLTYADMITLLMAFFIMLYSMSQLDAKKFAAVAGSVRAELGSSAMLPGSTGVGTGGGAGAGAAGVAPSLATTTAALQQSTTREVASAAAGTGVEVLGGDGEVTVRMPGSTVFFNPGTADLTPEMVRVLRRLTPLIAHDNCVVKVLGHTCSYPTHSARYPSNWELSSDRARNVGLFLVRAGAVSPGNCSFMGLADTQPLMANDSDAHHARNRRVEILLRPLQAQSADPVAETKPIAPPPVDLQQPAPEEAN
jgi:chemotaxis protein MotB